MNEELVKKLLDTKTTEEFDDILYNEKKDYDHDITLWDNNEVIEHCLELFDLTYEQFKWGFNPTPPKDFEESIDE